MRNELFRELKDDIRLPDLQSDPVKRQILKAACLELLEMGSGKPVNLSQLAKRSGMSIQRVRYHYKSFDEILPDLMMNIFVSGREVTTRTIADDPPTEPIEVIHRMLKGLFLWVNEFPHLSRLSSIFSAITESNSEIGNLYSRQFQQGFERILSALKKAYPNLDDPSLHRLAKVIHLYMAGALEDYHRKGHSVEISQQIAETWDHIQFILAGF